MKVPPPSRLDPLREGTRFAGKYEVIACLGQWEEAAAYKVRDVASAQILLLRLLGTDRAATPGFVEELRRSILLERSLSHENVERVYAVGEHGGTLFLVCEYSGGRELADLLRDSGRLPLPECFHLFRQICAGLAHIHSAGAVHGNLNTRNILVTRTGAVKLAGTGTGNGEPLAAEDVRAAGAIFLEMLGGTAPPGEAAAVITRCADRPGGFRDAVELLQAASRLGNPAPASRSPLTLAEMAGENPAGVNEVVPLFLGIVARLIELKSGGALHSGFSPRNVYVSPGGAVEIQPAPAAGPQHTVATEPKYCPPEMFREAPFEAGEAADIYVLGFALYEILAGRSLFHRQFEDLGSAPNAFQWLRWHADPQKTLTPLNDIVPNVPKALSDLVRRMTEKDPAQRTSTLEAVREGLESIQTRALDTQVPTRPPAGEKPPAARNRAKPFALALACVILAAVPAAWFLWPAGQTATTGYPATLETPTGKMILISRRGSPAFYIDEYEITNWQFGMFCEETGRIRPAAQESPEYPVRGISREDFSAYAEWAGKRLPSPDERSAAVSRFERRRHPWQNEAPAEEVLGFRCVAAPGAAVKLASSRPWRSWLRRVGWR